MDSKTIAVNVTKETGNVAGSTNANSYIYRNSADSMVESNLKVLNHKPGNTINIPKKRAYTLIAPAGNEANSLLYTVPSPVVQQRDPKKKVPRPPNAFMLFANEWRKKLAVQNPRESNKEISVRLGNMWKAMTKEAKERYFCLAREVDAEHKRKYPDYVYNPKEARLRKALREQSRESRSHLGRTAQAPSMAAQRGQQWPKNSLQQRHPKLQEDFRKSIRDQVDHGLLHGYPDGSSIDVDNIAFHPMGQMTLPGAGEYAILPDIDNQSWYPYSQGGQQNYMMRQPDVKMQGNPWNTYSDNRVYQGNPFAMRQQVLGGNSGFGSAVGQQTHNPAIIQRNTTMQPQQFPNMYPGSVSAAAMQVKNEREENLRMMNMIPVNSSSQSNQKIAATSGSFTTSDVSQESKNTSKKGGKCSNAPSVPVTTSTAITNSEANSSNTTESPPKPEPLPAFNESFVATEIGRISQEGFRKQQHNLSQVNQDQQNIDEKVHPAGDMPFLFSPPGKIEARDGAGSPGRWQSLFYYTGGSTASPSDYAYSVTPYGSYFDYSLLSGPEFIPGLPDDAVFLGIPSSSGFSDNCNLHIPFDASGPSIITSGSSFHESEDPLDFVTLHIPTASIDGCNNNAEVKMCSQLVTNNDDPLGLKDCEALENAYFEDSKVGNDSPYNNNHEKASNEAISLDERKVIHLSTNENVENSNDLINQQNMYLATQDRVLHGDENNQICEVIEPQESENESYLA